MAAPDWPTHQPFRRNECFSEQPKLAPRSQHHENLSLTSVTRPSIHSQLAVCALRSAIPTLFCWSRSISRQDELHHSASAFNAHPAQSALSNTAVFLLPLLTLAGTGGLSEGTFSIEYSISEGLRWSCRALMRRAKFRLSGELHKARYTTGRRRRAGDDRRANLCILGRWRCPELGQDAACDQFLREAPSGSGPRHEGQGSARPLPGRLLQRQGWLGNTYVNQSIMSRLTIDTDLQLSSTASSSC